MLAHVPTKKMGLRCWALTPPRKFSVEHQRCGSCRGLRKPNRIEGNALRKIRFVSPAIGARSVFFLVDQVVRVLGTFAIKVIEQTCKARLTRQVTEYAIACRACSRSGDWLKSMGITGVRLRVEQVDSSLGRCPRKVVLPSCLCDRCRSLHIFL